MIILFLLLWVILNGRLTTEVILVGCVISIPVYLFFCKFLNYSPKRDWRLLKRLGWLLHYVAVLLCEIIKANFQVMYLILSSKLEVEPKLVKFRTTLRNNRTKVILGNSITLTPGTITVKVDKDEYTVHCLDRELAEGIEESVFVKLLTDDERKEREHDDSKCL